MRWYILRALLGKEIRRHLANRGGLAFAALLLVAALLLSVFNPAGSASATPNTGNPGMVAETGGLIGGVHHCFIEYGADSPLIAHLKANVPPALRSSIRFRQYPPGSANQLITYPSGVGSIQIRTGRTDEGRDLLQFLIWHPKDHPGAMAGYEQWFWREVRRSLQDEAARRLLQVGADPSRLLPLSISNDDLWAVRESFQGLSAQVELLRLESPGAQANSPPLLPMIEIRREGLGGTPLDFRSAIATALVVFALYFTCVYLLPTLNCEERERGVLLAQALSPASPFEILAAKFLFYPVIGISLASLLAGIYQPLILTRLFFWLALLSLAAGFLGIGMTVASLARTQRAAFLGSMCYLMSVALILLICQQNNIPGLPYLAIEYHGPRVLHAAITGVIHLYHWFHLLGTMLLAITWVVTAALLFRRRGWQ